MLGFCLFGELLTKRVLQMIGISNYQYFFYINTKFYSKPYPYYLILTKTLRRWDYKATPHFALQIYETYGAKRRMFRIFIKQNEG